MYRFLHTGDWQMGMRATGLGLAAEKVRAARLRSIENLLRSAADQGVDAILAAGDQFEDNQVSQPLVEQVVGLLNDHARVPIYLIPGNHDPDVRGGVYRRPVWRQLRDHVRVLVRPEPVRLAEGVTLYPCPLSRKHGMEDPTAWIPERSGQDGIRIGLAHGTMRIRDDIGDDDFPIPLDAAVTRGLDYLALGHWHSTLSGPCGRCWYSGSHETTKFGERDSGNVLVVAIHGPGAVPEVRAVRTGVLRWLDEQVDLDTVPMSDLLRRLREHEGAEHCLIRVGLAGQVAADAAGQLDDLRALLGQRFLYQRCDDARLRPPAETDLLQALAGSPHLAQTARHLLGLADGGVADPAHPPEVARRALQLLQKALWESRRS